MKKFLSLLLTLLLVLSMTACGGKKAEEPADTKEPDTQTAEPAAPAESEPTFSGSYLVGTGSATGNYYNFGNAMCTVINNVTGANMTVNATGGSTENARLLVPLKTSSP
ncbi:TAXI family TRAP transporter solute-binding subunit [uncultured Dysosmobacter sp.]|uniref:TAXI family TRAP transporter solute-binding subunit n=1 Tax=uncultured Dysosmobacter sp. TaxID=2591384 RepID=UPI002614F34B|nr:TAXI family TRAP transporter solute-binding subunit [uncultured Dysosmobacter sp.]